MPKRLTPSELDAALRAPYHDRSPRILDALKALPEDVDPVLAARAAVSLIGDGYHPAWLFAKTCRRLPVPVIRAVLAELAADRKPLLFFLREYVRTELDGDALSAEWDAAMQVLLDLQTTYAWGSKQKRAKFKALAEDARVLQSLQTAAVACESVSLDVLAVLAADASDASVDALIPHVERAVSQKDWKLDQLQSLRTHARATPVMDDLFTRMETLLSERKATSPALDVARALGFGEPETFWFQIHLSSLEHDGMPAYRYQAHVSVDSRAARWFSVHLSDTGPLNVLQSLGTSFNSEGTQRDELELGTCGPTEVPAWLAAAARRFGLRWNFDGMSVSTSLRGKKRTQLEQWLRGG
jgi:hypothetical protein